MKEKRRGKKGQLRKKERRKSGEGPEGRAARWSRCSSRWMEVRQARWKMEMNDKVDDIVKKIPISAQDVYVTSGGRILKGSDKLKRLRGSRREHSGGQEQDARWRQAQGQEEQSGEETRHEAGATEKRGSGDSGEREGGSDPDVGRN